VTTGGEEFVYNGHFRSMFRFYPEYVYRGPSFEVKLH
jgi:hypothetical protein